MTDRYRSPEELEDTFRKASDPNYAAELEHNDVGQGWDTVAGNASLFARSSAAVRNNGQAYYILPSSTESADSASGAVKASQVVTLRRTISAGTQLIVAAGKALAHNVLDSNGQPAQLQEIVLAADAIFPVGSLGPISVEAIATRPGYQGNLPSGTFTHMASEGRSRIVCDVVAGNTATDTGDPDVFYGGLIGRYVQVMSGLDVGSIRRVLSFTQVPSGDALLGRVVLDGNPMVPGTITVDVLEWDDFGVSVAQDLDFTNGRHGVLDAVGRERDMGRAPGEGDTDYAYRLNELPDVVTPNAIDRITATILTPYQIPYRIVETREDIRGFVLDLSPLDTGTLCDQSDPQYGNLLLSENGAKRFFAVLVGVNANLGAFGLPFDAMNAGINAYDVASMPGDGYALIYRQIMDRLYKAIDAAHGAGVAWKLIQDPCLY